MTANRVAVFLALALAACGAGEFATIEAEAPLNYTAAVSPQHTYAAHKTPSDFHWWNKGGNSIEIRIGPDVAPREPLRHVLTTNKIRYFMGESRDGVGVDRLKNYGTDLRSQSFGGDFLPFIVTPSLILDEDMEASENDAIYQAMWDSARILNDALPPEYQMSVFTAEDGYVNKSGDIFVHLESPESADWGCSSSTAVAWLCLESGGNWFWRLSERAEFCGGQAARSRVSSAIS